jgi:hypothetical protein
VVRIDAGEPLLIFRGSTRICGLAVKALFYGKRQNIKWLAKNRRNPPILPGTVPDNNPLPSRTLFAEYEGPSRVTSIGFSDPRTQPGELLWPERFGPTEIAELKVSLGSYAAAGQHQQRPSPAGGGIFKRHRFRYWQPRGMNLPPVVVRLPDGSTMSIPAVEVPRQVDEQLQSWDCSFKDLDTSDYGVGQMWARAGAAFLLGDQVRGRMDCPSTVKAVRGLTEAWPGTMAILIEEQSQWFSSHSNALDRDSRNLAREPWRRQSSPRASDQPAR